MPVKELIVALFSACGVPYYYYNPLKCSRCKDLLFISTYFSIYFGYSVVELYFCNPLIKLGQVGEMPEWPKGTVC